MSLFQTLCLLNFNDGSEFTYEELKLATGIGKIDVWLRDRLQIIFNNSNFDSYK